MVFLSCFIGKENPEVVQDRVCIDFLFQEFRFFGMKVKMSVGMFEIAERNFGTPSLVIAVFYILQIKRVWKTSYDIFICILSSFDFRDVKLHEIKMFIIQKRLEMGNILVGTHIVINKSIWQCH